MSKPKTAAPRSAAIIAGMRVEHLAVAAARLYKRMPTLKPAALVAATPGLDAACKKNGVSAQLLARLVTDGFSGKRAVVFAIAAALGLSSSTVRRVYAAHQTSQPRRAKKPMQK